MAETERKLLSMPAEWWEAIEADAERSGETLSAWVRDACRRKLPASVRRNLPEPLRPGPRPGAGK